MSMASRSFARILQQTFVIVQPGVKAYQDPVCLFEFVVFISNDFCVRSKSLTFVTELL